jgi:hypothetical protein
VVRLTKIKKVLQQIEQGFKQYKTTPQTEERRQNIPTTADQRVRISHEQ